MGRQSYTERLGEDRIFTQEGCSLLRRMAPGLEESRKEEEKWQKHDMNREFNICDGKQ